MGGTASPLLWCMSYDPIVEGLMVALGIPAPTYVDDLAGLILGPQQALRASFYLTFASWAAGLEVSAHHCRRLEFRSDSPELRSACSRLLVATSVSSGGQRHVSGMPLPLLRDILESLAPGITAGCRDIVLPCQCSMKTALVPARHHDAWRVVMDATPFGSSSVKALWPYLGAAVTSCVADPSSPLRHGLANPSLHVRRERVGDPASWCPAMIQHLVKATWRRAEERMTHRASIIAGANASFGRRALMWNAYADSLVPYPARVAPPHDATLRKLVEAQRRAMQAGTPWCPPFALTALGVLYNISGAPRCPLASSAALTAWAHVSGDPWGPSPTRVEQAEQWHLAVRHADQFRVAGLDLPEVPDRVRRAGDSLLQVANNLFRDPHGPVRRTIGRSLYTVQWHRLHHRRYLAWIATRSRKRRWAVGDSEEWGALSEAPNATDAARTLRLLCNALPGRARWRCGTQRRPHTCSSCGTRQVHLVWRSPSPPEARPGDDGLAWCLSCMPGDMSTESWAYLPDCMLPPPLLQASQRPHSSQLLSRLDLGPSTFGSCPLCGYGEAGAEHIWQWCPAVVLAWRRCGSGLGWRHALLGRGSSPRMLITVASQTVFLYTSLLGRSSLSAMEAANRITAAVHALNMGDPPEEEYSDAVGASDAPVLRLAAWSPRPGCSLCQHSGDRLCTTSRAGPGGREGQAYSPGPQWHAAQPVVRARVEVGRILATLYSPTTPAAWMLATTGWWPAPRAVAADRATCAWHRQRCSNCGTHEARLVARVALSRGQEVTVPRCLTTQLGTHSCPFEICFDGACLTRAGQQVMGGGATLWQLQSHGPPVCIARALLALPLPGSALHAEAHACALALDLLAALTARDSHGRMPRSARVVGDCTPVVRFGAGLSRLPSALCHPLLRASRSVRDLGWHLDWLVIGRTHNSVAHDLAACAACWASCTIADGLPPPPPLVLWRHLPPPPLPVPLPPWPP